MLLQVRLKVDCEVNRLILVLWRALGDILRHPDSSGELADVVLAEKALEKKLLQYTISRLFCEVSGTSYVILFTLLCGYSKDSLVGTFRDQSLV